MTKKSSNHSQLHGLTSTTLVVLPEEHQHEYEEVLRGFRESFQPHGATEDALVLRLAQAHWRSLRSRRVETGILDITAATERALARKLVEDCPEHLSPHNAIAVGFMKNPEERWRMYLRYDGAISRDFFRTLDALTRLQRARQRTSPDPKPLVAAAGSGAPLSRQSEQPAASECAAKSNDATKLSDSGIRSVSQNSPKLSYHENHTELTHKSQEHESQSHESKDHEPKEQKHHGPRRALRSDRPVAHPTQDTPDRVLRKDWNLRRLSASARVLLRSFSRPGKGNHRELGRQRKARNRATAIED